MKLRDYQEDCLKAIEENLTKGTSCQLVVLPTGSGKTVIFSELINAISCHQASILIDSLLEKDGGQLKATNRQIKTLTGMGMEKEEAESLNFKEASSILWKDQQSKRSRGMSVA